MVTFPRGRDGRLISDSCSLSLSFPPLPKWNNVPSPLALSSSFTLRKRSRQFTRINEALDISRPMPPSTSPLDSELAVAVSSNVEYVRRWPSPCLISSQSQSFLLRP